MAIFVKRFKGEKFAWATAVAAAGNVLAWSEDRSKACEVTRDLADKVAAYHQGRLNAGRVIFEDGAGVQCRASAEGSDPPPAPVMAANRDDMIADLREDIRDAEEKNETLVALIGKPPKGTPESEWGPRAETWHLERANWQKEVAGLKSAVEQAVAEVAKKDAEIKELKALLALADKPKPKDEKPAEPKPAKDEAKK